MPPNMSGSPLSLSVTLTPIRKAGDTRTLTLKPGQPCLIGRASKSVLKNLQACPDNALYDCPVISRKHAELRAHLWDRPENQVSIVDKGSMHGTRVNGKKLREGQSMTLRGGDVVQFGEVVSRGDSTHDGIFVTFDKRENFSQQSHTLAVESTPATNRSGVYRYPYTSEEESDCDSEEGSGDEVMEGSSAKTTPEQAKAVLGSQGQPIVLDQPSKSKRELIEDSMANEASVLVEDSVPVVPRKAAYVDGDSEDEANDDSLLGQGSGVESIGRSRSRALSYDSLHESESEDDVEHPDVEARSDDESDGDESDLDRYSNLDQASEGDLLEASGSASPEPAKEPSPELRSSGETRSSAGRIAPQSTSQPMQSSFDRNNTLQADGFHRGSGQSLSYVLPAYEFEFGGLPSRYDTYRPSNLTNGGNSFPSMNPYYHSQSAFPGQYPTASSRWDMPPAVSRAAPVPSYPMPSTGREIFSPPIPPSNTSSSGCTIWGRGNPAWAGEYSTTGYRPQFPKLPAAGPSTSRISIPDMLEDDAAQARWDAGAIDSQGHFAGSTVDDSNERETPSSPHLATKQQMDEAMTIAEATRISLDPAAGKKRKAEDERPLQSPAAFAELSTTPSGTEPADVEVTASAPKKVKLSDNALTARSTRSTAASSFAGSLASYAAVASGGVALGAGGLFAFLCSSASEQLLNRWS